MLAVAVSYHCAAIASNYFTSWNCGMDSAVAIKVLLLSSWHGCAAGVGCV